jgi:hypothetical protein
MKVPAAVQNSKHGHFLSFIFSGEKCPSDDVKLRRAERAYTNILLMGMWMILMMYPMNPNKMKPIPTALNV